MNSISGKYTTKRDGGVAYTFEATFNREADGWLAWDAKVRLNGDLAGTPNGQVMIDDADAAEAVRDLVCDSIERKVAII